LHHLLLQQQQQLMLPLQQQMMQQLMPQAFQQHSPLRFPQHALPPVNTGHLMTTMMVNNAMSQMSQMQGFLMGTQVPSQQAPSWNPFASFGGM
jgi:hypothetical protein